jgi:hypothetical protein
MNRHLLERKYRNALSDLPKASPRQSRLNPADAGQLKGITVMSTLSRRGFLNLVGKAGGVSAVYQTMAAMGLLSVPAA